MIGSSTSIGGHRFAAPLFTVCFLAFAFVVQAQTIRYVKQGGSGDGTSWANAAGDLQAMINASAVGDEIWVTQGTYLPTRPANNVGVVTLNNRNNAFTFTQDLKIYGGFPAVGNPGMADRDWEAYPSVLSGNLGDPNTRTDNAYHVVITAGASVTADFLMDGFTITEGYGDGSTTISVNGRTVGSREGAGWHNVTGSPTVSHVLVTGNAVGGSGNGAGWYNNSNAHLTISHSIIRGNQAGRYGGGMHNGNSSGVTMENVTISDNTAASGGGLNLEGSTSTLTHVIISGNAATVGHGGGILNVSQSELMLTDVLITGNKAVFHGGGIYNSGKATLTNVTISGNTAGEGGALGIELGPRGSSILQNCIIWGNSSGIYNPNAASISYSLLQDGTGDPTNITGVDPLFNDAPDHSGAPFTLGDYRLQAGSPVIDAGNNALYTGDLVANKDLIGNPRLTGSAIDMGAYEFSAIPITPGTGNIIYVNRHVSGGNRSGASWANALPELTDALQWARDNAANWTTAAPLQIWVAAGEYQPVANESFEMVDHVQIYGGFAGTENALNLRDWHANRTTLHGNGNSVVRNPAALTLSRDAVLDGFTIRGGEIGEGGGIYNHGNATFANLIITENTGSGSGGGMRNFGSPLLYNVLFTKNSSPLGAGFFNTEHDGRRSEPILINVTSSGNEGNTGQELHIEAGGPIIRNSIFYGNGVFSDIYREYDIKNSLVQNQTINRDGNIPGATNPLFTDAANGDFSLRPASAAINAGSNRAYVDYIGALAEQLDLHGAARAQQGTIDMGAFESTYVRVLIPAETGNVIYVDMDVDQRTNDYTGDGSSWANAIPDLWNALTWVRENADSWTAADPLQIWVAQGEYQPSRGESFEMVDNVKIYGGFEGMETSLTARNLAGYNTALYAHGNSVVRNPEGLTLSRNAVLDGFGISTFGYLGQENASEGGGIYNSGDATFGNLYIMANTAETAGGGVYNTGSPLFYNVIIAGNSAPIGGGFYNASANSAPALVNVTISGSFTDEGQAFYLEAGNPIIRNSVLYGNGVFGITDANDIQYSLVEGRMATDNGNIADVGFPLLEYASIELMMLPTSPTINTGSNQAYIDLVGPFDDQPGLFGFPRLQQGVIDMGAIESPFKKALNPDENNIVYINKAVDQTTTEYAADGSSWANAVPELADALMWARVKWQLDKFFPEQATGDPLKIYVAKGTYLPLYGVDEGSFIPVDGGRDNAFVLVPNTMLYGGFDPENGITALTHQRIAPSVGGESLTGGSILSGNIGDVNSQTDNAYHVVIAVNTTADESFLVDGFAVTGGYADSDGSVWMNGQEIPQGKGGGWYNATGSPTIGRSLTSKNAASPSRTGYSADWLNKLGGNPVLTKLIADANRAKPTNMTGNRNKTYQVSALAEEGASPILTNVIISGNTAEDGGGMYNSASSPTLTNVLISGNTALSGEGGGIFNEQSSVTLNNVTITSNTDRNGGGVISNVESTVTINNSIIYRNTGGISGDPVLSMTNSLVQGQTGGSDGNLDGTLDPLFNSADNGDFSLKATSPVIDKGSNDRYPGDLATDLDLAGNPRLSGVAIDMGAYESGVVAITAFADIPAITVPFGTVLSEISVPDLFTVETTLSDEGVIAIELERDPTEWTLTSGAAYNGEVAGTYAFDITVPGNPSAGYGNPLGLRATMEVIVEKGMPVISWADPASITYGTMLGDDQLNASADVGGTFAYEPAAGTVLPAGDHILNVTFTPDDDANYTTATADVTLTVSKATPVIDWATPAAITYGTVVGDEQLNASADVAGTFKYDPAAETVLPAGDHTLNVTFTPDDDVNYTTTTAEVTLTVGKATPVINWPTPAAITYGTALGDDQLNASTDVAGTFTYDPGAETVLPAGDHTLNVTFTPDDDVNYTTTTAEVTLTVGKATPVINWPTPAAITYGTALGDDQLNASTDVAGTFTYDPGAETVLIAGEHTLKAIFTPDDDANYTTATAEVVLTVGKATPVINWPTPAAITYGTAVGDDQLNASTDIDGTFVYDPAAEAVLPAGDHTLNVTFTPDDDANYSTAIAEVTLTVGKATPVINWATPAAITYGTALGDDQLNASADVAGAFTYVPAAEAVLPAGDHTLSVTFTPYDEANYTTTTAEATLTVGKATPVINWATPASITYGTALGDDQLNASADVAGTFTYDPAAETVLPAGDHTLSVTFTPEDGANYTTAVAEVVLTVNKALAIVIADALQTYTYDGTVKNAVASLNHSEAILNYGPQSGYVDAGTYRITVTVAETANYQAASMELTLTITKADWTGTPVTFPNTDPIVYDGEEHEIIADDVPPGSEIDYIVIDGDGNEIPGNAITDAGDYTVIVVIRQDNYEDITVSTPITISKAQAIITADAMQAHAYDGTLKNILASLNHGETTLTYSPQRGYVDAGTYGITVTAAETANYRAASMELTLTITKADWTGTPVTFPDIDPIVYDGQKHEITADDLPPGSDVTYTVIDGDGNEIPGNTITDAGDYTVVAVIRQDNYEDITVSTPVTVAKARATITADALQTHTYDGTAKNIVASVNHGETTLVYTPLQGYTDAGDYRIEISAPESANYLAATATTVTLRIERAAWNGPAITLPETPEFTYDGASKVVAATSIPPGATVEYTVTDANGNTVSGNEVSETGEYVVTATVKQDNYHDVVVSTIVTVHPGLRTLDFPTLAEKTYGDEDFNPGATASTGEVVSFTSDNPAVATIVDGEIRIVGAGTTTITATVPENPNYADRPQVARQLMVSKAEQVIALNAPATVERDVGSILLMASSSSNLPVTLTIDDPQVATLEGTTLHIHRLGTVQITAVQAGDANHQAAETVIVTLRVVDPDSDLPVRVSKVVSPNGDGVNEFLLIEGIRDYPENKVTVFNRNGTVLYEANGYNNGSIAFRGISAGQLPLNAGTYFYIIEVKTDGKWKHEKGWFVLRY